MNFIRVRKGKAESIECWRCVIVKEPDNLVGERLWG